MSPLRVALETVLEDVAARRDHQARHRRIVAAVILECAQVGYTEAKIVDIATRAKVSTATIYRVYGDRDQLFIAALEMMLTLVVQVWQPKDLPQAPLDRLHALLLAHGKSWRDPDLGSIIRMYIFYANSKAPHLLQMGLASQKVDNAYWQSEIDGLEQQGLINGLDRDTRLAIILGAVERRTILARLGFGEQDDHQPDLERVARHSAEAFFQVYGTPLFWLNYAGSLSFKPANGFVAPINPPVAKLQLPSLRLRAYAKRIMEEDIDRMNPQNRKVRIKLAAMLTCLNHGYDNASMAAVAEAAKVSTATLYLDYEDKQTLFLDALMMQARFIVDYHKLIDTSQPHGDTISSLIFSISRVLADPDFLWYHYAVMTSELSAAPDLVDASRETRTHNERFWRELLEQLILAGHLKPHDTLLSMNLLLGATQRGSIQALLLFGPEGAQTEKLADLSVASTAFVLRLFGVEPS